MKKLKRLILVWAVLAFAAGMTGCNNNPDVFDNLKAQDYSNKKDKENNSSNYADITLQRESTGSTHFVSKDPILVSDAGFTDGADFTFNTSLLAYDNFTNVKFVLYYGNYDESNHSPYRAMDYCVIEKSLYSNIPNDDITVSLSSCKGDSFAIDYYMPNYKFWVMMEADSETSDNEPVLSYNNQTAENQPNFVKTAAPTEVKFYSDDSTEPMIVCKSVADGVEIVLNYNNDENFWTENKDTPLIFLNQEDPYGNYPIKVDLSDVPTAANPEKKMLYTNVKKDELYFVKYKDTKTHIVCENTTRVNPLFKYKYNYFSADTPDQGDTIQCSFNYSNIAGSSSRNNCTNTLESVCLNDQVESIVVQYKLYMQNDNSDVIATESKDLSSLANNVKAFYDYPVCLPSTDPASNYQKIKAKGGKYNYAGKLTITTNATGYAPCKIFFEEGSGYSSGFKVADVTVYQGTITNERKDTSFNDWNLCENDSAITYAIDLEANKKYHILWVDGWNIKNSGANKWGNTIPKPESWPELIDCQYSMKDPSGKTVKATDDDKDLSFNTNSTAGTYTLKIYARKIVDPVACGFYIYYE